MYITNIKKPEELVQVEDWLGEKYYVLNCGMCGKAFLRKEVHPEADIYCCSKECFHKN